MKTEPLAKKGLQAHSIIGLFISAVLYIICLSGTISLFKDELLLIEQHDEPVVDEMSADAAYRAAENGMLMDPETKHLFLLLPSDENPRAIVETDNLESYLNKDGSISVKAHTPWNEFLIDLHYYLTLPNSFGMLVVAIFGVFLFAMSITGIVAHPKIFKDAFRFRRDRSEQLEKVDLHNRLSVWTAPFHISNSLTGAMIGLATLSALFVGTFKYDGDFEAVFAPVFGAEPEVNFEKAPMARIDKALKYMAVRYPEYPPIYVILHDPGTKGQYLQIMAEHMDRLIYAEKYNFNGDGEFIDTVGSADGTVGQQVADSVYRIHFGYFGGLPVKLAFAVFGICLLVIITSGMKIYFLKQRKKGRDMRWHQAIWSALVYGSPFLLFLLFLVAYFQIALSFANVFWLGLLGLVLLNLGFAYQAKNRPKIGQKRIRNRLENR